MKKFLTLLLAICMCVFALSTFAACGGDGGNNDGGNGDETPSTGVTEEVWNDAKAEANFDNVTFQLNASFVDPAEYGDSVNFIKLAGDKVAMKEGVDGEYETTDDADIIASVKSVYVNTVLAIAEDFDKFAYDEANDCYKASADIVYTVDVEGVNATITAKNAVVTLNASSKIAKIACNMTQAFTVGGVEQTFVLDTEFIFSDYGTTVVE